MCTPIFDELEDKWSDTYIRDRSLCEIYWPVVHVQTGQEWYEDDEGNEVFPEADSLHAYIVPQEVKVGDTVTAIKVGEPQPLEFYEFPKLVPRPKRKFKLFGRNQETQGTL